MTLIIDTENMNLDSNDGTYYEYNGVPFTGILKDYRNDGTVREEVHFKDGYRHGPTIGYFPDGTTPQLEDIWNNNRIYSSKQWDIHGNLESETITTYGGGVIYTEIIKRWNTSGTLIYHAKKVEDNQYNKTTTVIFGTDPWA